MVGRRRPATLGGPEPFLPRHRRSSGQPRHRKRRALHHRSSERGFSARSHGAGCPLLERGFRQPDCSCRARHGVGPKLLRPQLHSPACGRAGRRRFGLSQHTGPARQLGRAKLPRSCLFGAPLYRTQSKLVRQRRQLARQLRDERASLHRRECRRISWKQRLLWRRVPRRWFQ